MYNELIDALRYCSDNEKQDGCDECPFLHNGMCHTMLSDAADAIERLQAENNALGSENETYHKLVLLSVGEINELRYKLRLDEMEIDGPFSIEDLKIPSGNGFELQADGVSKLQTENDESNREEKPNDTIRPN